jgi:hypothetical protein
MSRTHRLSIIGAVIVCFVSIQGNATLFASEDLTNSTSDTQMSTSGGLAVTDVSSTALPSRERFRFTLDPGFLAANPSLGLTSQSASAESSAFAGQIRQGRPYRMGRNGSIAALMIGAVATITGAAILVYANRPECDTNQFAGGCGYGTKVIGGSVVAGGVVSLFVGALTWR